MSQLLIADQFPLHGSRLIEASAGTGKTWTIAALYVRLVLAHGGASGYGRPLHPAEILVMTFTRAATRELSDRIRQRLNEAARFFRGENTNADEFLESLLSEYPSQSQRDLAGYRLSMAAESMDEAAVLTIDAWCQRMLREHAFDSACLFDEELISSESALFENAVRDYWRQQVYPLQLSHLHQVTDCWADVYVLQSSVNKLLPHADRLRQDTGLPLAAFMEHVQAEQIRKLAPLKSAWKSKVQQMTDWFAEQRKIAPKQFSGVKLKPTNLEAWLQSLQIWMQVPAQVQPQHWKTIVEKLNPDFLLGACNKDYAPEIPAVFHEVAILDQALQSMELMNHALHRHAAVHITDRMTELKGMRRQFGFNDMLQRLKKALEGSNGANLRQRILQQYPVAMIDEFQDTSPDQYAIFNALYRIADNAPQQGLFLIGDPKQSIYGFRGADIRSYLAAREATEGRHYVLGTNFRSTQALVSAVNQCFLFAEQREVLAGEAGGAFQFRIASKNPVPFEPVSAHGKKERFLKDGEELAALHFWFSENAEMKKEEWLTFFAEHCAEHVVSQLNADDVGFASDSQFQPLRAADIAILVRDRFEADAVRRALQRRQLASVYLSDKDSVLNSDEAKDVLRWLQAMANPLDTILSRAALASKTAGLSLSELARLADDDEAWEDCVEQLKELHAIWQRQGVLAAIRRFIYDLKLPQKLLAMNGGERFMTNLLHLAELLETASEQLDGEQALVRWFAEQIADDTGHADEHVLRLESDADLVKVVTVHKSKGLQYPVVYLPYAFSAKTVSRRQRSFFEFVNEQGEREIDFNLSARAMAAVDQARKEEDIRLLYVAMTRAVHALYLGVASHKNKISESAIGYLLNGHRELAAENLSDALHQMRNDCASIQIELLADVATRTNFHVRQDERYPVLFSAYQAQSELEKNWTIASFSSITRSLPTTLPTARIQDAKFFEDEQDAAVGSAVDQVWHRFPRGPLPGQFLHDQLEWMAEEGFDMVDSEQFDRLLANRCSRAGWANREMEVNLWLREIVHTVLPPVKMCLTEMKAGIAEMEFWFPCAQVRTRDIDALCQQYYLPGVSRVALSDKSLHGLLMGFADLVFERDGKYWVLDYKSNALGADDASYHAAALEQAIASHRYDVQGAIYLLALHRLLINRLGDGYDPVQHLGGAIFFFLRGIAHPLTRGCHVLPAHPEMLKQLDQMVVSTPASPMDIV